MTTSPPFLHCASDMQLPQVQLVANLTVPFEPVCVEEIDPGDIILLPDEPGHPIGVIIDVGWDNRGFRTVTVRNAQGTAEFTLTESLALIGQLPSAPFKDRL